MAGSLPPKPGICHILWNEDPAIDKLSKLSKLTEDLKKIGFEVKAHTNLDFRLEVLKLRVATVFRVAKYLFRVAKSPPRLP